GVSGLDFLINPSGSSPSVEATTAHTVASPVTLTTVLNISRILSGAMIRAIPAAGTPIDSKTMINMIKPAPGTPAEPMEANVAVSTMVNCCVKVRSIPKAWAINTAATPWYKLVPSMFTVAPNGSTKLLTSSETPSSSSTCFIVTGRVAELELVVKASSWAGRMA